MIRRPTHLRLFATALYLTAVAFADPVAAQDPEVQPDSLQLAEGDSVSTLQEVSFSLEGMRPVEVTYDLIYVSSNEKVGSTTRRLEVVGDGLLRLSTEAALGVQTSNQSVVVRASDLQFQSSRMEISAQGQSMEGEISRQGERIVGVMQTPVGVERLDMEIPSDALVGDMLELALWSLELRPGMVFSVPIANLQTGEVEQVQVAVAEEGTLEIWNGEVVPVLTLEVGDPQPQTMVVLAGTPHLLVELWPLGQPIRLELTGVRMLDADDPGGA